ncbi:hypothetical protein [Phocaeicola paurosaccharolyticus]|jgi:hypothetical protein|uniref:hypothetical protein n=2 Tax=Phocaeicola paurosaccharolyticus TaxID=732242 RepID=UPI00046A3840|nr:hypothetical protein [Phocaeicola paurosaccharolyticus]
MNITIKTKEILVSTLERRFKKLHDAANFAEDCSNALAFHSEKLMQFELTTEQANAICKLNNSIGFWTDKFSILADKMQSVESQYIDHLSEDKTKYVLIEEIPTYAKNEIPNTFQMSEKLFDIGYYKMEGDPYGTKEHKYTREVILNNLQELHMNVVLCIKALVSASYNGIWKEVEQVVFEIYDTMPSNQFINMCKLFAINKWPELSNEKLLTK